MTERDPIEVAARSLRHRDRSRRELDDRLARAGIGDEARAEALDTLGRVGYVDDVRLAATRAAALAARGLGDAAIRHDLERRRVDADAIAAALGGLEPERERAVALVLRLGRTPKTAARLARRGFGVEALESALESGIAADGP